MIDRRHFLTSVLSLPVALCIPWIPPSKLRSVWRVSENSVGGWIMERVRMHALQKGDVFYFGDHPRVRWRAAEDGEKRPAPEYGAITAERL